MTSASSSHIRLPSNRVVMGKAAPYEASQAQTLVFLLLSISL